MQGAPGGKVGKTNRLAISPNPHSDPLIGISSVDSHSIGRAVDNRACFFGRFRQV